MVGGVRREVSGGVDEVVRGERELRAGQCNRGENEGSDRVVVME